MPEYIPDPLEQLRRAQLDVQAAQLDLTRAQEAATEALARFNREIGGEA